MRIAPINQNNNKKNTSFGTFKSSDLSRLSTNAQKVAKAFINEPETYLKKLFLDKNKLVFIKSNDEKNTLLLRVFDKKSKLDSFWGYELGVDVKEDQIEALKTSVLKDHEKYLKELNFIS